MEFASKLKELRQQRDLSLRKLGEKSGISYSILNSIENGRIHPSRDNVIALAYALKVEHNGELLAIAGYATEGEEDQ
ncbi:helix-turn-helix domain-containing protein [Paenibacillus sp. WQ 127069]|uniref:Helix-turn-helix domain-containing protein n=1 Tax=Paenibacillus baimaensis TaxID=2982185 RepID=A0ABT2USP6_9BACL|nr:helix-turn-helix transcriptional regulator [Paenibacillus sp. WQ 127069]MCU6797640.1 helix-turn-helix domain-containing protein [Paenibacillus sp. WQ 127069]